MKSGSIIVNPMAGDEKYKKFNDELIRILSEVFESLDVYETSKPGDSRDILNKYKDKQWDTIIIAGGDGTVYEIINAAAELAIPPVFGIIPCGTCNDFSRALGINQHPIKAAEQIAERRMINVDVGTDGSQYFLNFWGIGLITDVSERIDEEAKGTFGRFSYYISALRNLNQAQSFFYEMSTPNRFISGRADMILVANGPFTGGIRAFFPETSINDGKLDVLIVKEANLQSFIKLFSQKGHSQNDLDGLITFQTDSLNIETLPSKIIDCDGERQYKTPKQIRVLPNKLKFLANV